MARLRIGSRGSQLAFWQANHISALLRARGHEIEIEIIHTTGDKITDVASGPWSALRADLAKEFSRKKLKMLLPASC